MKPTRAIFGFHAVLARMRADPASVMEIYLDENRKDGRAHDLALAVEKAGVSLMRVPTKRLDGFYGGGRHQGVVAMVLEKPARESLEDLLDSLKEPPLLLVLDGVTDPHNLGACLRVADAAGAHAVIAPKDRAAGISAAVSKVASGAAETVPYYMVTNLARTLDELKERNLWIVGADERAEKTLYEVELPEALAWVLGAEGEGMRRLTRDRRDLLDFRRGALAERHAGPVVPVARVVEVAFDPVQQPMDAEGELVAHAHDDRVGLVPFALAQMGKSLAMLVGRDRKSTR